VEVDAVGPSTFLVWIESDCFPFPAGVTWGWGLSAKLVSGATDTFCREIVTYFSDGSCTTQVQQVQAANVPAVINPIDPTWQEGFDTTGITSHASTQSARYSLSCQSGTGDFVVRLDDGIFGENVVPVELMSFSVE
jgi:hypothetical protein